MRFVRWEHSERESGEVLASFEVPLEEFQSEVKRLQETVNAQVFADDHSVWTQLCSVFLFEESSRMLLWRGLGRAKV